MEPFDLICLEKMGLVQQVNGVFQFASPRPIQLPPKRTASKAIASHTGGTSTDVPNSSTSAPQPSPSKRGIHLISTSSYIRWILDWSRLSARYPIWPRTWLTISTTWVSIHHFLPSLSPLVPSSMFREVSLSLYFIPLFFTTYIGDNVRFRCGGGLAILLGVCFAFSFPY